MEPEFSKSDFSRETKALREAWMRHDDRFLNDYLVSDVEDPRIHFPSILTRGLVAELLFSGQHRALIWEEYRFGICMSYMRRVFQKRPSLGTSSLLLEALKKGDDHFQSIPVPTYLHETWKLLNKLPDRASNYIAECLVMDPSRGAKTVELKPPVLNTFQDRWRALLAGTDVSALRVMEPACGSANDYRFMHSFGFGHLMTYRGFDICAKNIANARGLLPDISFEEGSVFDIRAQDREVDYLYVHDLFEHLSLSTAWNAVWTRCVASHVGPLACAFSICQSAQITSFNPKMGIIGTD